MNVEKVPFLCGFMDEVVILSDGTVTTCCMDPLANNVFGNIYTDSFEEIERRYIRNVENVVEDVHSMPRCTICYNKIADSGFKPGRYKLDFSAQERSEFLDKYSSLNQLVIEPSSICNLKCNGCMQQRFDIPSHRKAAMLDMEKAFSFLKEKLGQIKLIRLYNYGETFLNKQSIPFIDSVKKHSPATYIHIATNGLMLNTHEKRRKIVESGVDRLTFSIHGGSQESVEPYMTKVFRFDNMLEILKDLSSIKKEHGKEQPVLEWKYLLFEWNDSDEEIAKAIALVEEIGLDSIVFVLPGYPSPSKRFKDAPEKIKTIRRDLMPAAKSIKSE